MGAGDPRVHDGDLPAHDRDLAAHDSDIAAHDSDLPEQGGRIVAIAGPTAVGKTAAAVRLAERLGGEIVSLDSRQMVRRLEIGTAKPTAEERARAPHHLVDIVEPDAPLALAQVQALAYGAIDGILARGRLPLVVGGTGQYVLAVLEGWIVPSVEPNPVLRAELEAFAAEHGHAALHARLAAVDPVSAERIDARNVRRVVRALEVHARTGESISTIQSRGGAPYASLRIGLTRPRAELYARIDARIDAMLAAGLEDEVRDLVAAGYGFELPAMNSVGYREWRGCIEGVYDRAEAIRLIRRDTRRLVRMQDTWFHRSEAAFQWFDLSADPDAESRLFARVSEFIASTPRSFEMRPSEP
jgi:tRNA dimethylallyltransferase